MTSDSSMGPGAGATPDGSRTAEIAPIQERLTAALRGRFEVTGVLGRGGTAIVFRGRDLRHDREVAIKVLRPQVAAVLSGDRFIQEIQISARLDHPHILPLFDSGTADGLVYFVMPVARGESLRQLLQRERKLSIETAITLVRETASALDYAHSEGVVHRDVKPENILLSAGQAVLADFGIAAALGRLVDSKSLTDEGIVIGTPAYMSPEQANGEPVDGRSDVYSLGCVLFEILAGEPPFTGRTPQAVIARHVGQRPPSLQIVRPDVPRPVVRAIRKALAKAPGDRYQSAGAMARALEKRWIAPAGAIWLALGGTALAALVTVLFTLSGPGPSRLDRNKVAVFPLEELGLDGAERGAGGTVAIMIAAALEHADPLRPLDVRDRLPLGQRENPASLAPGRRAEIARSVGASSYIGGVIQGHSDSVTVGLRLYDVEGDSLVAQRSVGAPRQGVAFHRLGIDAVKGLLSALVDPRLPFDLAPLRDRNVGAIALFVQGEREYRRSRFAAALDLYRRALREDSALALAAIKGALAAYWSDHAVAAELAKEAAARYRLLPPRYADFARGLAAFAAGQADSAEQWIESAVRRAPEWPEALMQLGEVYYHLAPLRPDADSLAERQYRAAIAADSGFNPPLVHLVEIAVRHERLTEARQLRDRFRAGGPPPDLAQHVNTLVECVATGAERFDWIPAVRQHPATVLKTGRALAAGGRQIGCAEGAFRAVLDVGPDSLDWGAALGLHSVLTARGQARTVEQLVDSVVDAGVLPVMMTSYLIGSIAGLPVEAKAESVAAFGMERWGKNYEGLAASRQLEWLQWLFGSWHARRGDRKVAESVWRSLRAASEATPLPSTRALASGLGAQVRLLAGDTAGAIASLQRLIPLVPSDSLTWSMALPLAAERLTLAELLAARRDFKGALEVAAGFDHPEPLVYVSFLPASLRIRRQAAVALGRRDEASRYQQRLARLGAKP